jgi:hypothetical protein
MQGAHAHPAQEECDAPENGIARKHDLLLASLDGSQGSALVLAVAFRDPAGAGAQQQQQ